MKRYLPLIILLVVGVLAGVGVRACSNRTSSNSLAADGTGEPAASAGAPAAPFADCRALTSAPPEASGAAAAAATDIALPTAELSCFGGGKLRLADVRGPAVINLWGSWCPPCREELPSVNAVAQRTAGLVHFLGVNTRDSRSDGEAMTSEFGLSFANVFDQGEQVRVALKQPGLPVTLFVDSAGKVVHLYNGTALDEARLADLVKRQLGVAVPVG
ncbi:TlpA disulfide reductase family protein [Asanoa sp. WMMD1127]|uniref:TlpA family protein disulfide reductase n=1 Tax=Asanoa sp. WMMD1127 TaxID=3016107 RepID=UPI002417684E|nr:TlpA disulfide reductase family protein [Asanoa sp. WMMD1127]MDG4822393.1 TlpA disulfide reductase family protein [Asanoa sp. WMMD1127]